MHCVLFVRAEYYMELRHRMPSRESFVVEENQQLSVVLKRYTAHRLFETLLQIDTEKYLLDNNIRIIYVFTYTRHNIIIEHT